MRVICSRMDADVARGRDERIDDLFGTPRGRNGGNSEGCKPRPICVRCQSDDRHATRAQCIERLGRQVRIAAVDDGQVRNARAGRCDHLGEVSAASNNCQGIAVALYRLDEGCFVSLISQYDDPVNRTHGAPTGTAASPSVEL